MNEDQRMLPLIKVDQQGSGPDAVSTGSITIAARFSGLTRPRSKDELRRQLRERQVNSIEDICGRDGFDVRIDGSYTDVDGQRVEVSIPVRNEETFTPDGMTHADPALLALYIRARSYEECARYLSSSQRDGLSEEEIARLETAARMLEQSLAEEANDE